jgi:hypothetical protein
MTQKCKFCGNEVAGVPVSSAGMHAHKSPIGYRFACSDPGDHGDAENAREWFAMADDPVGDHVKRMKRGMEGN